MSRLHHLERVGFFSMLDVELARSLCRIGKEPREEMQLAVALASRNVQQGHICLDLKRSHEGWLAQAQEAGVTLPEPSALLDVLRNSPLVACDPSRHDTARPLVLDDQQRLYLARYHDHERVLAEHVRTLAQQVVTSPRLPDPLVDALFPDKGKVDMQRVAALSARGRRLSVVVGGPGTGKTSTVVKLLAFLFTDAQTLGIKPPRVLLVAPTGKAAQRLTESIEQARAKLALDPALAAAIPSQAQTVHRALGSIEGSLTQFRHHREHPLQCDVLLLDEASMVDLALMRRLFDALPSHARVIMLGDPDQLASVEAGGVLSDLCAAADTGGPLAACVTRLTESHRYAADSGIASLAEAIRVQDSAAALTILTSNRFDDVRLEPGIDDRGVPRALTSQARAGYAQLKDKDIEDKLTALGGFRVLCAHRKGRDGVETLNQELERTLRSSSARSGEHYPGRPILITQNDYGTGLFNGDVGVIHAEGSKRALALYLRAAADIRRVALGRLPAHESVYAMSVHKSQGSEFERVAIVLPERLSPVLTRELLFTAVTRARQAVTLYAKPDVLRAAIEQRVHRESGLVDRLR